MIETLAQSYDCIGGFIAYWNDSPLYPSDPEAMFRKAIAVLITQDERILVCPVDLTEKSEPGAFRYIPKYQFSNRSTGALFFKGCYFSIREGDLQGSYQISSDFIKNQRFSNERAYTKFLLNK